MHWDVKMYDLKDVVWKLYFWKGEFLDGIDRNTEWLDHDIDYLVWGYVDGKATNKVYPSESWWEKE